MQKPAFYNGIIWVTSVSASFLFSAALRRSRFTTHKPTSPVKNRRRSFFPVKACTAGLCGPDGALATPPFNLLLFRHPNHSIFFSTFSTVSPLSVLHFQSSIHPPCAHLTRPNRWTGHNPPTMALKSPHRGSIAATAWGARRSDKYHSFP